MTTRKDLAQFIVAVSRGDYSKEDWQRIAVTHYTDEAMEEARRKLVRYILGYPAPIDQAHKSVCNLLIEVAKELES